MMPNQGVMDTMTSVNDCYDTYVNCMQFTEAFESSEKLVAMVSVFCFVYIQMQYIIPLPFFFLCYSERVSPRLKNNFTCSDMYLNQVKHQSPFLK